MGCFETLAHHEIPINRIALIKIFIRELKVHVRITFFQTTYEISHDINSSSSAILTTVIKKKE